MLVRPRGELDAATRPQLETVLGGVPIRGGLVLDLAGLTFMDSAGLNALTALHRRACRSGALVRFVAPPQPAGAALAISGLDGVLPFAPTAAEALAQAGEAL